jgi:hypothetical protein
MMKKSYFGLALAAVLATANFAPAANASDIRNALPEGAGVVTNLGANVSAVTYWVGDARGWNVVTTIDSVVGDDALDPAKHAIVRFASVLQAGQTQVISVPESLGSRSQELRISRVDDRIVVALVNHTGA